MLVRRLDLTLTKANLPKSWLWPRDFFTQRSYTAVADKQLHSNDEKGACDT